MEDVRYEMAELVKCLSLIKEDIERKTGLEVRPCFWGETDYSCLDIARELHKFIKLQLILSKDVEKEK
jgi:hypothetical protein